MKPFCYAALTIAAIALPGAAQPVISAKSGLMSYMEGQVFLNDQPVEPSNTRFADVKENSTVRTTDGRVEVLLTPGVTLRLGENSSLRMITNRLVDTRVELLTGSAVVEADLIEKDTNVTVVLGQGSVALPKAGLYRFDSAPAGLKVFKGDAEVEMAGQSRSVSSGRMLSLAAESASIEKFDTDDTDPLDRWSHRRGSYLAMANTSAAHSLLTSGYVPATWGMGGCSSAWGYNSYYGMMTFIPCNGMLASPYGYRFWSPYAIGYADWIGAPRIFGGGAVRTGNSPSGAASLARPATTASYRSTSSALGRGPSHAGFGAPNTSSNAAFSPSVRAGGSTSGGFSGGSSSGGFSRGGGASAPVAVGGGGGAAAGGGHAGGGAAGGHR